MKPLPLPVRIAAGLAATAIERARDLPAILTGLPVTVASQALQVTMRVQQHVTELAIKGDEALASLRPVEEKPEWATFDEDIDGDDGFDGPAPALFDQVELDDEQDDPWELEEQALEATFDEDEAGDAAIPAQRCQTPDDGTPWGTGEADEVDRALGLAGETAASDLDLTVPEGETDGPGEPARATSDGEPDRSGPAGDAAEPRPAGTTEADAGPGAEPDQATTAPAGLANYAELSLPQLRARLRGFSLDDLDAILAHERAHENRPAFVGMLARRIETVRAQS